MIFGEAPYDVKIEGKDFDRIDGEESQVLVGTRDKVVVRTRKGRLAIFKRTRTPDANTEDCSEKIASELAKCLHYDAAEIDLAVDLADNVGILSYIFTDKEHGITHTDAIRILSGINQQNKYYVVADVKTKLERLYPNEEIFAGLVKILLFDALVGEYDRHASNWGVLTLKDGSHRISPIYDTASCLMREYRKCDLSEVFGIRKDQKDFEQYLRRCPTKFRDEKGKKLKAFELARNLRRDYREIVDAELRNIDELSDREIESIVLRIPESRMTKMHKQYIIRFINERKRLLAEEMR